MQKTKLEKELEGNEWFNTIIERLQSEPRCLKIDIEIIIVQAMFRYLTHAITFIMFLDVIERIQKISETNNILETNEIIKKLLSLSQYAANPKANTNAIIKTLTIVANKIQITAK